MKVLLSITLFFTLFTTCKNESKPSIDMDLLTESDVLDFVKNYDKAWADRDTSTMKKIMHENYTYFTSTGKTTVLDTIISWFTPADKYKLEHSTRVEVRVTYLKGNTAVVSSRWVGKGTFSGYEFNDDQRCGLVIQKEDGKTRIVSEHCVQIAQ